MILGGGHEHGALAVAERKHRDLGPAQLFFQEDGRAGGAEAFVDQHAAHNAGDGLHGGWQDDTLARGQPAGLDDGHVVDGAQVAHGVVEVSEDFGAPGGDAVTQHERLGEGLRALQLGGCLGRAEDAVARGAEGVDNAGDQRCFRADNGKVDRLFAGESYQGGNLLGADGHILGLGHGCCAAVAGRHEEAFHGGRLC